ncbi:extracellular solute-binding protein [Aquibacillus salsiterrae]|uniref:Extracellular solute-binding protein n=1 Tax=Aquibacillus salsiterrae TaxID=2950439 RepID=A0A9X4ADX0_9BACI|nr:extracellular solute-binding protein [Aquibacillus salsiterrae]MDC3416062.1 extracellular solute-binding protein [Aquibacillus salsiterrae]
MNTKKAFSTIFVVLVALFLLAGCGSNGDSASKNDGASSDSDDSTVINFMHQWTEGSSAKQNKLVNDIISAFEKENPGVKVEQEVLSAEQYKDKLKVLAASNELPDVGQAWPGGWLKPYAEGNKFASFDDILDDEFRNKFAGGTLESFEVEGKTYGLPEEINITGIFYNKAIFEENGVEVPTTLAELKNVATVLKDNGVTPIALGNKDRWTGSIWYMYLADRIAGPDTIENAVNRTGTFEDPGLIEAAAQIQELVGQGAFIKGTNGMTNLEAENMFMNGLTAMYLTASWSLPNFTTNEDTPQEFKDNVGYFKFPTVEGGKGDIDSFVGGTAGVFVAEKSEVKEEAKQFAKFFVEKLAESSLQDAGIIPAMKLDTESLDLPPLVSQMLGDLANASDITLFADNIMTAQPAQVHLDMIQSLFGGNVTPEEFVEAHEEALSNNE